LAEAQHGLGGAVQPRIGDCQQHLWTGQTDRIPQRHAQRAPQTGGGVEGQRVGAAGEAQTKGQQPRNSGRRSPHSPLPHTAAKATAKTIGASGRSSVIAAIAQAAAAALVTSSAVIQPE
jgi:hypothetical protein